MSGKHIHLEPRNLLDDNWKSISRITLDDFYDHPPKKKERRVDNFRDLSPHPIHHQYKKLQEWIESTRIEIAESSQTKRINSDKKYDYLHSEIGMNIVIPKGRIAKMRFRVSLKAKHRVVAIDGFPKDVIEEKEIAGGKIKVVISKFFKFIPVIPPALVDPLEIEFGPWEFKLGSIRRVNIDFSGGLTSRPEWYFKKNGIKNDLRIAMTIRKPKKVSHIEGKVKAAWVYDPGFFRRVKVGTGLKSINIC